MTALSADARRTKYGLMHATTLYLPQATGTTIYANGLVCFNASGYAAPAADTANFEIAGLAVEGQVNSGADAAKYIRVLRGVMADFAFTGFTIAGCGKNCCVADDNTVTNAATATNDVEVGQIVELTSASLAKVHVGVFGLDNA